MCVVTTVEDIQLNCLTLHIPKTANRRDEKERKRENKCMSITIKWLVLCALGVDNVHLVLGMSMLSVAKLNAIQCSRVCLCVRSSAHEYICLMVVIMFSTFSVYFEQNLCLAYFATFVHN